MSNIRREFWSNETTDSSIQEYSRKCNAAQARADTIAGAFSRLTGIELKYRRGGVRSDLFYHCLNHPGLPDEVFAEWLAQAHASPANKRLRLWARLQHARSG
jgi:hypothetical protein